MEASIIPIGNSKGIRIPKALLDQCGFGKSVQIVLDKDHLILRAPHRVRDGWDDAFKAMAAAQDDLLADPIATDFDESDWQW